MRKAGIFFVVLACVLVVNVPRSNAASMADLVAQIDQIINNLEALRLELAAVNGQNTSTSGGGSVLGVSSSKKLTQPIVYGETNDDIALVQRLLASDPAIYPYGVDSGFFGPKTQEAIRNLQTRFNLDSVGVVGPETTALLEAFLAKYPTGTFPADALSSDPRVKGVTDTSEVSDVINKLLDQLGGSSNTDDSDSVNTGTVKYINAEIDQGEANVLIRYKNDTSKRLLVFAEDEEELIDAIANKTSLSKSVVKATLNLEDDDSDTDYDDNDAEDAIDDADEKIDNAQDEIDSADEDNEDIKWADDTLDEAKDLLNDAEDAYDEEDWDKAVKKADEAADLAEKAEARIGKDESDDSEAGDADEIDEIEAEVDDGETEVTVKYDDDDDYVFTVDEDKEDDIIDAIADELDISVSDVEDLISFDFGDVEEINVMVEDDEAFVTVDYESGVRRRFEIDESSESDMIEEIADYIDEDEDDVEDWTDFDFA